MVEWIELASGWREGRNLPSVWEWGRVSSSELENPGGRAGRRCGLAIFLRLYLNKVQFMHFKNFIG